MKKILYKLFAFLHKKKQYIPVFKHYIITRFWCENPNIKNPHKWIESRVDLFNKFYIKSINSQSNQNFEVILLVSRKYIDYDFHSMGFNLNEIKYKIICLEDFILNPSIILTENELHSQYIITTRLDSDDMLSKNFIKRTQSVAVPNTIIDHSHSFMTFDDLSRSIKVSHNYNSTFLSTVFAPLNIKDKHCYSSSHNRLFKKFHNKFSFNNTAGLIVCHNKNILNKIIINKDVFNTSKQFFQKDFFIL
jgi:hypothetical protein